MSEYFRKRRPTVVPKKPQPKKAKTQRPLVSTKAEELQIDVIEQELLERCTTIAYEKYGIELHAIGLSRLSLPKQNIK